MFELYDGHGPHGEIVSQQAAKALPPVLDGQMAEICQKYSHEIHSAPNLKEQQRLIAERNEQVKKIMENSFQRTEEYLSEHTRDNPEIVELSGCTGSVLLVIEDFFVVANAGDSPIILFRLE